MAEGHSVPAPAPRTSLVLVRISRCGRANWSCHVTLCTGCRACHQQVRLLDLMHVRKVAVLTQQTCRVYPLRSLHQYRNTFGNNLDRTAHSTQMISAVIATGIGCWPRHIVLIIRCPCRSGRTMSQCAALQVPLVPFSFSGGLKTSRRCAKDPKRPPPGNSKSQVRFNRSPHVAESAP